MNTIWRKIISFNRQINYQHTKKFGALIIISLTILILYLVSIGLSYQFSNSRFLEGVTQNYKQQLILFIEGILERVELHTQYVEGAVQEFNSLFTEQMAFILDTHRPVKEKYDDLIRLSERYQNGTILLFDERTGNLSSVLSKGVLREYKSEAMSLEEVVGYLDNYTINEFEEDSKVVVSGYSENEAFMVGKYNMLKRLEYETPPNIDYDIIQLGKVDDTSISGKVIFSSYEELGKKREIILDNGTPETVEQLYLQDILRQIYENDSSLNVIKQDDRNGNRLSYARYYPEYKWIIVAGGAATLKTSFSVAEFESFNQSVKVQINLAILVAIFSLFLAIIGGWIAFNFSKSKEIEYERKRNRTIDEHNRVLISKNQQINQIVHDIKNHLICIKGLIQLEQSPHAMTYIDSVFEDIRQLNNHYLTGNRLIDIILNEKIDQMKKANIQFYPEISKVDSDFIDQKDITSILTNLFDNAIESCEKSEKKEIYLNLFTFNDGFIVIKMRNSCDEVPISIKGKLYTSKLNKDYHGYGVINIKRAVKKYDGETLWEYSEQRNEFSFIVTIPIRL